MARRQLNERNIRKIVRSGNGTASVSIPVEFMRALKCPSASSKRV